MRKQTQSRTLGVILSLMLFVIFNTSLQLVNRYSEWVAWALYALMVVVVFGVLRFQGRLTPLNTALILALPFVLGLIAALLGL